MAVCDSKEYCTVGHACRLQVGDQIVEINGEPTQGITHTRAIELIQAGGSKVMLLLRPGPGLTPDHSELQLPATNYLYSSLYVVTITYVANRVKNT